MATYEYPIDVSITAGGATANQPSAAIPWIILVTTGTSLSVSNSNMSGTSTTPSCFEITGTTGTNKLRFTATSATVYATVCVFRFGASYAFSSGSRVYSSGHTFYATCNCVDPGNMLVPSYITGSTFSGVKGAPYYRRNGAGTLVNTNSANKPYLTKSSATSSNFNASAGGLANNSYVQLKYLGFSSSWHAGNISARTVNTYVIPVSLYVQNMSQSLGTIEIYAGDVDAPAGQGGQDSFMVPHYGGSDINGDSDTLNVYTDMSIIYLGVDVDNLQNGFISIYSDGGQIYSGNLQYSQRVALNASSINYATVFTINISGSYY